MPTTFDHEVPTPPDRERGRARRPRRWRSARIAAGAVAGATALLVAVPSVASALPIREQGSAVHHAPGSTANHGHVVLPLMTGRVGDLSSNCVPPTSAAVRKPGIRRSSGARLAGSQRVAGTGGKLGGDEEGTIVDYLLQSLKDNAVAYAEDGGFGWALNLLSGQQPSVDPAEIDAQFAQVDSQLSSLSNAQYQDCQAIENAVEASSDANAYSTQTDFMNDPISKLNTAKTYYSEIVESLYANHGNATGLTGDDITKIQALLPGGTDDLNNVVSDIISNEGNPNSTSDNLVQSYGKVLTDQYGYDPYKSHIFPAAFVNAGYAQQQYYASLLTQALFIYANVQELTYPSHTPDPQSIIDMAQTIQAGLASWSSEFSDGPRNDGTPDWVSQGKSQGIGPLPSDTVLDYRVQDHPMLWTTAPVNLSTGASSASAPYYCGTTAQFCYAAQYPISPLPVIGDLQLATPSPQPLPALIDAANYDGLTGWRVPTLSDWKTLIAGAGSTVGTGLGLGVWGPAHQLPMFTPQTVTSYWAGLQSTRSVIGPALFATGDSSDPYGVVTNADPADLPILLPVQSTDPSGESDQAGRLFLVQDFQPSSGSAPSSAGKHLARPGHTPAAHTTVSHPAATHVPAAHGTGVHVYNRGQAPQSDLAPVTFSTPTVCSASNSGDTYTVPDGTGTVQVTATGGAGASGTNHDGTINVGGRGGSVAETFPVTPGQTLHIQVGGAAKGQHGGAGGGADGGATNYYDGAAGGGGGASGVSTSPDCSKWLVVAGGGGGGGAGGYLDPGSDPVTVMPGGVGGDGCAMTSGSCAAATAGHSLGGDEGGAGGMSPHNVGGTAASGALASTGGAGANMAGGQGGTGGDAAYGVDGGSGGGGGAGYYGGGGGGAAGKNESGEGPGGGAAGGGGGGGASFAIPGGSGVSYGLGSAGQDGSVTITPLAPAPPKVSISASASDTTWGQPVTLTATVEGVATGTVTFTDGGQSLGTATILGGTATLTTPATLAVGDHQIVASYSGSPSYAASQSAPVTVTVGKATPVMAFTINGDSTDPLALASGQSTSLTVQMPADATGSVGFYDDINNGCEGSTAPGAKCQGEGVAPIVNGVATLTSLTVPLTDGTHYLHASWGGGGNYNPSDSNTVTVIFGTDSASHHKAASHHRRAKH